MDILSALFWWRRDRREARQEERDAERLRRESRHELHTLLDRDVSAWQKLFDSERDEGEREQLRQELLRRLRAQAVLLDDAIVRHPDFQTLPSNAAELLGEGNTGPGIPRRLTALAGELIRDGHSEQALQILCLAQEVDPQPNPWIALEKAHALSHVGQMDQAVGEFDALASQPSMRRRALTEKSLLLMQFGRQTEAMAVAEVLLAEGDDPIAAYVLSTIASWQGQHDRALQLLDQALARWPGHPVLLSIRLRVKVRNDALDVVQAANELLAVDPDDSEAYRVLAERYLKDGDIQGAMGAASKAVELDPKSVQSRLLLARSLARDNQREKALAEIDIAGQLEPANPQVPFVHALVFLEGPDDGQHEERRSMRRLVVSALSAVIEQPTTPPAFKAQALVTRGMMYFNCDAWEMGSADIDEAIQIGLPKDFEELAARKLIELTEAIPKPPPTA